MQISRISLLVYLSLTIALVMSKKKDKRIVQKGDLPYIACEVCEKVSIMIFKR